MKPPLRVLMIEDVPTDAELLELFLGREFTVTARRVETQAEFERALEEMAPDVILSDYRLPRFNGLSALAVARVRSPNVPFIMVTGPGHEETVAECMREGATDYLLKDRLKRLNSAVRAGIERKRAEARNRMDRDLLRLLFEHADDLVVIVDVAGTPLRASVSYLDAVGWSDSSDAGTLPDVFQAVIDADRARVRAVFDAVLARGTGSRVEYRIHRHGGECRHLEGRWDLLPTPAGEPPRAILVARDITDRKSSEEALRRSREDVEALNAELVRAHEAKTELLANMTHELRTPMNSILGFSDLLLHGPPVSSEEAMSYLKLVHDAGRRLIRLIDDLLDLARIEAGRLVLNKRDFDLRELLESTVAGLFGTAGRGEVTLRLADGDCGLCHADPVRLRQVALNLMSSAIRLTPPGGRVDVAVERGKDAVALVIDDTSEGLSAEDRERIFQAFEQVTSRATGGRRGCDGIGLAITREVIQAHGGELTLLAGPQGGNRFVVTLPLVPEATPDPSIHATSPGVLTFLQGLE